MSKDEKYIPEAISKVDRFLSPTALDNKVEEWKEASQKERGFSGYSIGEYSYWALRIDSEGRAVTGDARYVDSLHGMSFIKYIEDQLKDRDTKYGKFKVLDLGGGAGLFAEQLRQKFGNKIDVFTTGLRKKPAKELRRNDKQIHELQGLKFGKKINVQDLKWRSIEQLTNYPEFDLIIDTWGEALYTETDFKKYLMAVIAKLQPNGLASITFDSERKDDGQTLAEMLKNLHTIVVEFEGEGLMRIRKMQK